VFYYTRVRPQCDFPILGSLFWAGDSRFCGTSHYFAFLRHRGRSKFAICFLLYQWTAFFDILWANTKSGNFESESSVQGFNGILLYPFSFLSFFLGGRRPNIITRLSGWWAPDQPLRTQKTVLGRCWPSLRPTPRANSSQCLCASMHPRGSQQSSPPEYQGT